MTAEITPETLRLAGEGANSVERLLRDAEGDLRLAHLTSKYVSQILAIRSLISHATEMIRNDDERKEST